MNEYAVDFYLWNLSHKVSDHKRHQLTIQSHPTGQGELSDPSGDEGCHKITIPDNDCGSEG